MPITEQEFKKFKDLIKAEVIVEISGYKTNQLPIAHSVTEDHLFIVADKVTGIAYQASEPVVKDAIAVDADFHSCIPTTVPFNPKDGSVYFPTQAGTYTNFKDQANAALVVASTDGVVYFVFNGTYWTKVASTVNLSNYTTFTDVTTILAPTKTKVDGAITASTKETGIVEIFPEVQAAYFHNTSTFNGWGTGIGVQKNFNTLKFKVRARAGNAIAITKLKCWIVETSKAGAVVGTVTVTGLSIAAGIEQYITITFTTTIANAAGTPLLFFYKTDQLSDQWCLQTGTLGVTENYTTTTQNIDTETPATFTTGAGTSTTWCKVSLVSPVSVPTQDFKDQVLNGINPPFTTYADLIATTSPIIKNNTALVTSAMVSQLYESGLTELFAEATAVFFNNTSTFSGWGTPIGTRKNFNTFYFRIRARAGNVTPIARVRCWITENGKTGAVLGDVMITGLSIAAGTDQYLTATFPTTIANATNTPLFFFYKSDQVSDQYGLPTGPVSTGRDVWTTTGQNIDTVTPSAFSDSANSNVSNTWGKVSLIVPVAAPSTIFKDLIFSSQPPPSTTYADLIATTSPIIKNNTAMVTSAMVAGTVEQNLVEIFPEAQATYYSATSTFSGWGSAIGVQKNFNSIRFKIRARAGNVTPITKIRGWITTTDKTGAVLGDVMVTGLSIAAGIEQYVLVTFSATIANATDATLLFFYKSDQLSDHFAINPGTGSFENYTTTAQNIDTITPSGFSTGAGKSVTWCKVLLVVFAATPTPIFLGQIIAAIPPATVTPLSTIVKAEIVLPANIFCIEARECNIWLYDVIFSNLKWEQFDYDITCTKGTQLQRCWRYLPTSADAGTTTLTIDVYFEGVKVATATTTINTVALSAGSGIARKVICVGDSTTAGAQYIVPITSENPADVMTLSFNGTQGTAPNKHEGRSGWRMSHYAGAGITSYFFNVTGITTPPGIGSVWSDGTSTYTVIEVNITGGTGYFSCNLTTGTGTPPATGTLTKVSGTGQTTIPYTSTSTIAGNPFWNGTAVSLTYYMAQTGITLAANDWLTLALGINDIFSDTASTIDASVNTYITNIRAFINAMHAGVTGLRVGIFMVTMPAISQDAFGANYTTGQALFQYTRNVKKLQQRLITEFDNATERAALNFLLPTNAILDRENSFPKITVGASKRETTNTVTSWTNGVHPATSGYQQMADQLWAFLKKYA